MKQPSKHFVATFLFLALMLAGALGTSAQQPSATFQLQTDQYRLNRLAPGEAAGEAVFSIDRCERVTVEIISTVAGISTSIVAPGGQVLTAGDVEAAGGSFTSIDATSPQNSGFIIPSMTPGFHYIYTFPWLGAGNYTVRFQAGGNLNEEVAVVSQVTTDSPIGVKLFATENEVVVGKPLVLTAAVFDGQSALAGANVVVDIKTPAGSLLSATLRDDGGAADDASGDGLYGGEFIPAAPGKYLASARITGTTAGGISYTRESATEFKVVPSNAVLTGGIQDQGVDDDGDGLFERAAFNVQTQVTLAGNYRAFVHLRTAGGQSIVRSGASDLEAGAGNIGVDFEASALIQLGEDGPYKIELVELMLLDIDGPKPADHLINLGQTQPYQLSLLQRPSLVFTGHNIITAVDANSNGKYDILRIQVEVLVRYPGFYQWSAPLADSAGREIDFVGSNGFLNAGSNLITFTYDGKKIGGHGVNGPYNVRNVLLFGANEQSVIADRLLDTPSFFYREFENSGDVLRLGTVTATGGGVGGTVVPGEAGSLSAQLVNIGGISLPGLNATLSTSTPGVTINNGVSIYPGLSAGAGAANNQPFTFNLDESVTCGQEINFKLTLRHVNDGGVPSVFNFSVLVGESSATVASYTGSAVAIPDGNFTGVNIPLTVSGFSGNIADLNFRFDGSSCTNAFRATTVGLDHSWVGDLVVTLTSPQGTTVTLLSRPGGPGFGSNGLNFCNTLFDDEGGIKSIQNIVPSDSPHTGTFRPAAPLAAFRGENPNGVWVLNVSDREGGDTGNVRAFSLIVTGPTSCQSGSDATPPTTVAQLSVQPNGAGWHNADVSVTLNASDNQGGSGIHDIIYSASGAQTIAATNVNGSSASLTFSAEGITTVTFYARDNAGNTETVKTITLKIDKTAPAINVSSPTATLLLHQDVLANYTCSDGGAGVNTCNGSVPAGGVINTTSIGLKQFSVTATDMAGNVATRTLNYTVSYGISLKYDLGKIHKSGSTVPIKLQLVDANGINVSESNIVLHATATSLASVQVDGEVEDAGNANPDDNFRFTNSDGQGGYIFNLKTTGMTTGTYVLIFKAGSDPFSHRAQFQIK